MQDAKVMAIHPAIKQLICLIHILKAKPLELNDIDNIRLLQEVRTAIVSESFASHSTGNRISGPQYWVGVTPLHSSAEVTWGVTGY